MTRFSIRPLPKYSRLVLSEKAQISLVMLGVDIEDIEHFADLRNLYIRERSAKAIDRITTYELERLAGNGLMITNGMDMRKERDRLSA